MVSQYPHQLQISQVPETYFDVNTGVYWPAPGPTVTTLSCRLEPNGKGMVLKTSDGEVLLFAFIVYLPLSSFKATAGDNIALMDETGTTIYTGIVARFNRGFFNMRLWV